MERLTGLPAPFSASERRARTIVAPQPDGAMVYTMDAETRSFVLSPRSTMGPTIAGGRYVYIGGVKFVGFRRAGDLWAGDPHVYGDARWLPLGTRRVAGAEATGRRITMTAPPRYPGNGGPTRMSDERWESAELCLLVQSRHADSRSVIEYRLSNLLRDEPAAHLFEIPPDYTAGYPITAHDKRMSFVAAESFRADRDR